MKTDCGFFGVSLGIARLGDCQQHPRSRSGKHSGWTARFPEWRNAAGRDSKPSAAKTKLDHAHSILISHDNCTDAADLYGPQGVCGVS